MRTSLAGAALVALLLQVSAAHARPPTVVNSPGYEARLAEQRKAAAERRALEAQQDSKKKNPQGVGAKTAPNR